MDHYSWHLLCKYADGELTLPERHRCDQHMEMCTRCRHELELVRKVDAVLGEWGRHREVIPASTERRVVESVGHPRRRSRVFALGKMMPAALGSSAAALLVLISVNFGWQYQNPARIIPPVTSRVQTTQVASANPAAKTVETAQAKAHLRARLGLMMNID